MRVAGGRQITFKVNQFYVHQAVEVDKDVAFYSC